MAEDVSRTLTIVFMIQDRDFLESRLLSLSHPAGHSAPAWHPVNPRRPDPTRTCALQTDPGWVYVAACRAEGESIGRPQKMELLTIATKKKGIERP